MRKRITMLVFIFLLSFFAVNTYAAPADMIVKHVMPAPGFSEGWTLEGKTKTFNPDNLYKHINGEAELYLPYGFEALGAALYISKDNPDKALAVDIYKMGSPLDAFGIYSRYRNPDSPEAKIGSGSFVNDSQLMFYQDRYFVQLSASGSMNPEPDVFIDCAKAIAKNIPGGSSRPEELEFLNIPDITPRTETYISQSVLGYAFFKKGLVARANLDGEPVRVFVVFNESVNASGDTLSRYVNYLKEAGVQPQLTKNPGGTTLITLDPLYKGLILRQSGCYLIGVSNINDPSKGTLLIDRIQARIPAQ
ncbi:MAG: hypothetical protein NTX75_04995 [Proteobacteria bacterium]|nr:hypothetical protein [Pseudomonadota bacterium]